LRWLVGCGDLLMVFMLRWAALLFRGTYTKVARFKRFERLERLPQDRRPVID
jgi:hypothetical protein